MFGHPVPALRMGDVRVVATADANRNSPVEFAVVVVADPTLEARLMNPEQKWFGQGPELAALYPSVLQSYYCEMTPGEEMRLPPALFAGRRALAVFLFANLGTGERRARIDQWRQGGVVTFARDGWELAPAAIAAPPGPSELACAAGPGRHAT